MKRTIESPLGWMRLFPVMAHTPPAGTTRDADAEPAHRDSSPSVEVVIEEEGCQRESAAAAA